MGKKTGADIDTGGWRTTTEAAKRLRLSHETVKNYCYRGTIPAKKFGRQWVIHESEVERYQKNRRGPGRPT